MPIATALASGLLLGLSAGIAPGPLLALVLSETLRHGTKAGIRVAFAPLVTDPPIILLALLLLNRLAGFEAVLGVLSLAGGCFLLYLGIDSLRANPLDSLEVREQKARPLAKGILANLLNPHVYLFWLSVGGPTIARAKETGNGAVIAFAGSFYVCLVGAKVVCAILIGRSQLLLRGRGYRYILRALGIALCLLGGMFLRDGIRLLGV